MPMQRTLSGAALAAMLALPAAAQTAARPTLSIQAGGFVYGMEGTGVSPMAAARVDWPLTRTMRVEAGGSFARAAAVVHLDQYETPTAVDAHTHLFTATVGVHFELPTRLGNPYVGVASGLFARRDPSLGERFVAPTRELMAGVRIPFDDELGIRAEVRLRRDDHKARGTSSNLEQTLGVTIRL